jgi:DNA-binding IclR family transcriptional regulator
VIQSLDRGIQILMILAEKSSAGVTELAEALGVDKSTASRLVETLRMRDMVRVDPETKKYRLGFRILHLGEALKDNLNVIAIARPMLLSLSAQINESVHFCAYNNNSVYVMDQVRSSKNYALSAAVGMIEPLHCSSVGKCILAFRRPETIRALLTGYTFTKYTEHTMITADALLKNLESIRSLGYALDDEEMAVGVRCLALPVYDYRNSVRYSIGVSGPKASLNAATIESYVKRMAQTAKQLSGGIGSTR